jgi:hypothetical protein
MVKEAENLETADNKNVRKLNEHKKKRYSSRSVIS